MTETQLGEIEKENHRICSLHFDKSDYGKSNKFLRYCAIPTLILEVNYSAETVSAILSLESTNGIEINNYCDELSSINNSNESLEQNKLNTEIANDVDPIDNNNGGFIKLGINGIRINIIKNFISKF